jgi:hypothetical protein
MSRLLQRLTSSSPEYQVQTRHLFAFLVQAGVMERYKGTSMSGVQTTRVCNKLSYSDGQNTLARTFIIISSSG